MRIAEINAVHIGSTGKIMFGIAEVARTLGHEVATFSPHYYQRYENMDFPQRQHHTYFSNPVSNFIHLRLAQMTGRYGCFSFFSTMRLLKYLDAFKPNIIHLHILHGCNVNIPLLFSYLKRKQMRIVWTFHDCWALTGKCPHFTAAKCNRWKEGCGHCPQLEEYPKSTVDATKLLYRYKKKWFSGISEMVIATPSRWLETMVRGSYLQDYPISVINNGIDLNVFSPNPGDFCDRHSIPQEKHIVLGVAFGWGYKKGLDVFIQLADSLGDEYQIVLVGTNENVDAQLPGNIISIHRTNNQKELTEIYSAADVFVNPTREETLGLVNIEALACGTPVITFRTGGSPETIDETCGSVVECDDVNALEKEIIRVCNEKPYSQEACLKRARQFDQEEKFREYVKLYEDMVHNK